MSFRKEWLNDREYILVDDEIDAALVAATTAAVRAAIAVNRAERAEAVIRKIRENVDVYDQSSLYTIRDIVNAYKENPS